ELGEEHRREVVVVVLARVDEDLLVLGAQQPRNRRGLDELRPVADDRDNAHGQAASLRAMSSASAVPTSADTGPGAADSSATPTIEAIGSTSLKVLARNASSAARRSSSVVGRSSTSATSRMCRRVIESRM